MKTKRTVAGPAAAIALAGTLSLLALLGTATAADREEYRLIRRALARPEAAAAPAKAPPQWLKIEVSQRGHPADTLKLKLPLSLVELVVQACPDQKISLGCQKPIDWKRVWRDLRAAGPASLMEVSGDGETVRIWLE